MSSESLRARLDAATPRPWCVSQTSMFRYPESEFGYPQRIRYNAVLVAECFDDPLLPVNARLISHAPTDLEAALKVIDGIKKLHHRMSPLNELSHLCAECAEMYPCATVLFIEPFEGLP